MSAVSCSAVAIVLQCVKSREVPPGLPDQPPLLLDLFMGGGATGLEALRQGCETHAVELNPVAHLIELCTLVYPQQYGRRRAAGRAAAAGAIIVRID